MSALEVNGRLGSFVGIGASADVSVVVVTYNSSEYIALLIADLRRSAETVSLRVIVVDNQSTDDTAQIVREHPDVLLIESGGNFGYSSGINVALPHTDPCAAVLILNPDLRLEPYAIERLLDGLGAGWRVGAVVPRILAVDGTTYPSIRREPSLPRALGNALFGGRFWRCRPGFLSESDYRPASYVHPNNDIDWATGAVLLVRADIVRNLGPWNESFFLYSEEVEYFRRIRDSGYQIRFEPSAVARHRRGGSGESPRLAALMAVNRVRYAELHHGVLYSVLFRALVVLAHSLRSYDPAHRRILAVVLNRSRWHALPPASAPAEKISGSRRRGAVIVPAYNEATVIERTLLPLSQAALDDVIELIVVCNGCTDDTAERARKVPGVRVVELDVGSKSLALNTGDDQATLWPRLYLDADIEVTANAVVAVLDQLNQGAVLAARPDSRYDSEGASLLVRSYYRARQRIAMPQNRLWSAGVYGLSEQGHQRFGRFPDVTGDDMFVDMQFGHHEKAVLRTEPSICRTPSDARSLVAILGRHHRGNRELRSRDPVHAPKTGRATAIAALRTVRGPLSATDAAVYLGVSVAARYSAMRSRAAWAHDQSSRSGR